MFSVPDIRSISHIWMADVDLEVRRLGGVPGLLKLLRPPIGSASAGFCADRIELGAAILACKVKNIPPPEKRCGSSNVFSMRPLGNTGEDDCGEQGLLFGHYRGGEEAGTPWETRVFIAALDALQGARRINVLTTYRLYSLQCRTPVQKGRQNILAKELLLSSSFPKRVHDRVPACSFWLWCCNVLRHR